MLAELSIIAVRGIGIGAVYAIIAMSFNVVFSSSGILNFAQGTMFILGGFAGYMVIGESVASWPLWPAALLLATVIVAVVVTVQGALTLMPLKDSVEQHSWLISTMAVSVILTATLMLVQGPYSWTVQSPIPSFTIFGMRTPAPYALAVVAMFFWYFVLRWFLNKTLTGLAISAISQDMDAARAAGLRVRRLQLLAFTISGVIVGSAGFIVAPVVTLSADAGMRYVLHGFIAAVVGGIGSNGGAVLGGILLGLLSMFVTFQLGGAYQDILSLVLLVAVLMIRPEGIFGRSSARRV